MAKKEKQQKQQKNKLMQTPNMEVANEICGDGCQQNKGCNK